MIRDGALILLDLQASPIATPPSPGRNPRPFRRRPTLPGDRHELARGDHLLGYHETRRSRRRQKYEGKPLSLDLLTHVSPLGWEQISVARTLASDSVPSRKRPDFYYSVLPDATFGYTHE